MAIAPLAVTSPPIDNSFNFGPLAHLGQIGQTPDALSNLARVYADPAVTAPPSATPPSATPPQGSNYSRAISGIESGGRYDLVGPKTSSGDQAYGKYQIMGANIPEWTRAALGTAMTPEQFLADRDAQEKTFQHRFGQYVDKYGPDGAARAWFAGEGGMNNPNAKDLYGTTVSEYSRRFNAGLGGQNAN